MTDLAPEPIAAPTTKPKKSWLTAVKVALLVLVLAFVARTIAGQCRELLAHHESVHVRVPPLLGTAAMLMAVAVIQAVSYRTLLGAYATAPAWRAMPTIAWVPPVGKYIPGGAVVAAVAMLRRLKIPVPTAVAVVLVQDGLAQLAGLIVSAPLLWWPPVASRVPWAKFVAIPAIFAALVCLWPAVFTFFINTLLRKLKRPPLSHTPLVKEYAVPMACAFGQWVLHGAALGLIVQSVTGDSPWSRFGLMMSFAALSQTLGYLAIFDPGGTAVRTAVLLPCLTVIAGPMAAVIVLIRAAAQVVVDLLMGAIGLGVAAVRQRNEKAEPLQSDSSA